MNRFKLSINRSERISSKEKTRVSKLLLLAAVFALFIVLCVSPAAAHDAGAHAPIEGEWVAIDDETSLRGIDHDGYYYLNNDIDLHDTAWVINGLDITLCLNGKVLKQTASDVSVIEVDGAGTTFRLCDCNTEEHYFYDDGTGLWVLDDERTDSTLKVIGGVITGGRNGGITEGPGEENGHATVTISGGNIVGNVANTVCGGGVYLHDSIFRMTGGSIKGNKIVDWYGGGVGLTYCTSSEISGGEIAHNTAKYGGGVAVVGGDLTISGNAIISDNTATSNGGGIYASGPVTMTGGSITGNEAQYGAGMYFESGTVALSGASITNNVATINGGGVFVGSLAGTFTVSGNPIIKDNTLDGDQNNVYLSIKKFSSENQKITLNGAVGGNSLIGVTTQTEPTAETPVTIIDSGVNEDTAAHFFADDDYERIILEGSSLQLGKWTPWSPSGEAPSTAGYYKLTDNITLNAFWDVPIGETHLDLNGFWLKQETSEKRVISIPSASITLILTDSRPDETTHYFNYNEENKVWSLVDHELATENSIIVNGGLITGGSGIYGGVYVYGGSFIMNGGTIIGNAAIYGGGVCLESGSFVMNGGTIIGNTATNYGGGGVYVKTGTFTVSGNSIIEDNVVGGAANNVYLKSGKIINLGESGLDASARIGVTAEAPVPVTITDDFETTEQAAVAASHFFADDDDNQKIKVDVNVLQLADIWDTWSEPNALPSTEGHYILQNNVTLNSVWNVPGTTYLDLNGYCIKQKGDEQFVIDIGQDKKLILSDSRPTQTMHHFKNEDGVWVLDDPENTGEGHLVVNGGVITGGNTAASGGAVHLSYGGIFEMEGGTIIGNTAEYGAGVFVLSGSLFEMSGGKIIGNTATDGAGVFVQNSGTLILKGGEITGNYATGEGGGVYATGSNIIEVSGDAKVYGNFAGEGENAVANNVYLVSGSKITLVTEGLGAGANIGVSTSDTVPVTITNDAAEEVVAAAEHRLFADKPDEKIIRDGSVLKLADRWDSWTTPNTLPSDPGHYKLGADVTLDGEWVVPEGETYLDLNGHYIRQNGDGERVIALHGGDTLIISDSNPDSGQHSFHKNENGVWTLDDEFDPTHASCNGGFIFGGSTSEDGGAVYLDTGSTFKMSGGKIIGNTATGNGGAVYVSSGSKFEMSDDSETHITKNEANNGAAVYVAVGGSFELKGGLIDNNIADDEGAAVYVADGVFTVSGISAVVDNENVSGEASNIILGNGAVIALGDAEFHENSGFGVSTQTAPDYYERLTVNVINSGMTPEKMGHFFADKVDTEELVLGEDGSLKLKLIPKPTIAKASLELGTDIAIRFKVPQASMVGYNTPYINALFNGTTTRLDPKASLDEEGNYVFEFRNISPAEMTVPIYAHLYAKQNGNEESELFSIKEYSVKQYCTNMLQNPASSEKLKTLCVDLLYYGSSSQVYVGETDASKLANHDLSEEDKNRGTKDAPTEDYVKAESEGDENVGVWTGGTVNLYSNISVMALFDTSVPLNDLKAEVTYGVTGNENTIEITNLESKRIKFNDLNALELNYPVKITLVRISDSTRSKTLTYGVDAYYAHARTQSDTKLVNLITDTMKYIRSVKEYVKPSGA